jgi:glucose/arabinose dehydrogenase
LLPPQWLNCPRRMPHLRLKTRPAWYVGYEVAFVPFQNGKPSGPPRDFATGWMLSPSSREVWGRPVGLLLLPDGSLLISEDGNNRIWKITYRG